MIILGFFIGTDEYILKCLEERLFGPNSSLQKDLALLDSIEVQPQAHWIFIKNIMLQKITHLMRVTHPDLMTSFADRWFDQLFSSMERKYESHFSEQHRAQMKLQLSAEGLGFPYGRDICVSAYLASSIRFIHNVQHHNDTSVDLPLFEAQLLPLLDEFLTTVGDYKTSDFPATADNLLAYLKALSPKRLDHLQDMFTLSYHKWRRALFVTEWIPQMTASDRNAFKLLEHITVQDSKVVDDTSYWLKALPIGNHQLSPAQFITNFRSRFRIPLPEMAPLAGRHCICGMLIDVNGDHTGCCKFLAPKFHTAMHRATVKYCSALDRAAHIPSEIEPRGDLYTARVLTNLNADGIPVYEQRYLDLLSEDGYLNVDGKGSLADVSGVYGIQAGAYRDHICPQNVFSCMEARVTKKVDKYKQVVEGLGFNFRPLIFEIYSGRLHYLFDGFIRSRCRVICNLHELSFSTIYFQWRCKLDIIIRQCYAKMVLTNALELQRRLTPHTLPDYMYDPPVVHTNLNVVGFLTGD